MKKTDLLSVSGVSVALLAVLLGQYLEGGSIRALLNGPAILIVVGGTIGATMLQSPLPIFVRAMAMLVWVVRPPQKHMATQLQEIVKWAQLARREGLLGLESVVDSVRDDYARKGLQLVIDGNDPEIIRETLELDSLARERRDLSAARVVDGMGGYAPTLGILGAVMGLIHVMENLSDPSKLGAGIAVAFVATIYGVGLANLVFLPIANRIKFTIARRVTEREILSDGLIGIAKSDNPRIIEARLKGYL